MSGNRYPLIAKEGWLSVALAALVAMLVFHFVGALWSIPLWIFAGVVLLLFRDPDREVPSTPLGVVSPCDGEVGSVETLHDPYLDREAIRVSVTMNPYGVFSTRSPVEGRIIEVVQAKVDAASLPQGVWIKTDEDDDLVVAMYRGPLHNSPRCYVRYGDRVGQGQRCGFIHLGSVVETYLPPNCRVMVKAGDHVRGGTDLMAMLVHK